MSIVIFSPDPRTERKSSKIQAISWQVGLRSYAWSPPTDVYESEISFVIRVEVAGMSESDFSIAIENRKLIISGVRIDSRERRAYHQMEIRFGEFNTSVELPQGVDSQHFEAAYVDGFITIVFPKPNPAPVKIQG